MSVEVSSDQAQISQLIAALALDMDLEQYQFEILTNDNRTGRTYIIRIADGAGERVERSRSEYFYR